MKNPFSKARQFYKETKAELIKSNWPDSKEIRGAMGVVFVAIFLLGMFIAIADFSVLNVIDLFTSWASKVGK